MWPVERPNIDAGESFGTCVSSMEASNLHVRLSSVRPNIEAAAADYELKANAGNLHLIPTAILVGGCVTKDEMAEVYKQQMRGKKKPGRAIYDQIKLLPKGDRCPYCDQRSVTSLDHILPMAHYPAFAVAPDNLVGACIDCNGAKRTTVPTAPQNAILHPYFDDVNQDQWLKARVVQQNPCALVFRVEPPASWSAILTFRVRHQFNLLGLSSLYSNEAASEISDIRYNLQTHFDVGGAGAVQDELMRQWRSRHANRLNSWRTATYEALAHDAWFHGGGFS